MATIFRPRSTVDDRSGGKITRGRRIAAVRTPYDRPQPPPPPPQSPNWLTGVIFPATRMIASGAGKLLSSVFGPDTSSSSSSSSESDSDSENDDDNDGYISPFGNDGLSKENIGRSSETAKGLEDPQPTVWKSETKRVIEQLLMHETFSREECNRLTNIINARVVDSSTIEDGEDGKLSEIPGRVVGHDTPDLCSKAVMEAQIWLKEKRVESSSKSDLDPGTFISNPAKLPRVTDGEVGSPVDLAKSYMRARPPWASPSISPTSLKTPSSVGTEFFKEGTPYSAGGNSFSSLKKRDPLATGSWNIQEELRRVRSKATEDMLRTLPSSKIDLSSFCLEPEITFNLSATQDGGVSTSHAIEDLEMTKDGSCNGALLSNPDILMSEQNQVTEEEVGAASKFNHSTALDLAPKQHTDDGSKQTANGFPSSAYSVSADGADAQPSARSIADENPDPVVTAVSQGRMVNSVPGEENCELLSETSVEVPTMNETNNIAGGSQNSSSLRNEEPSEEPTTQVNSRRGLGTGRTGGGGGITEKRQHGRKLSAYNKRGRGRGK